MEALKVRPACASHTILTFSMKDGEQAGLILDYNSLFKIISDDAV